MLIIGKGTDPNTNNDVTIAFDKMMIESLEKGRPKAGYPAAQETAIQEMKDRIAAYEASNGAVDAQAVSDQQEADYNSKLAMLTGLAKIIHPNG